MSEFALTLTEAEKAYLRTVAVRSVALGLDPSAGPLAPDEPPTDTLRRPLGAFVTLKLGQRLRGCIGAVEGRQPLYRTVWNMARAAAFDDPRFPPLTREEFQALHYEISILGPVTPCPDLGRIEVGRHGLIVSRGGRSGLLLPQVATEWGWDRETFLAQTCLKAGLDRDAWKDPAVAVLWFEAVVF